MTVAMPIMMMATIMVTMMAEAGVARVLPVAAVTPGRWDRRRRASATRRGSCHPETNAGAFAGQAAQRGLGAG